MAIIKQDSGCKVGWVWFDNLEEAGERSVIEAGLAPAQLARGYDFGFQTPGEIQKVELDGRVAYKVTTI